ncbi:MAG: hypothetical protein D6704_06085 [Nitrospirae bacterium]|nr:MAG: hypothetical protein D6704_06085 [Nitrospirota bacterium]
MQPAELPRQFEMRCLNCGWQPQYGERTVTEPEEARAIRQFTAELFSSPMHLRATLSRYPGERTASHPEKKQR